jgi:hypothetical protein
MRTCQPTQKENVIKYEKHVQLLTYGEAIIQLNLTIFGTAQNLVEVMNGSKFLCRSLDGQYNSRFTRLEF